MSAISNSRESVRPRVDLRVQISCLRKVRAEALARRIGVSMNDLAEHLIKRWVERTEPDQPDVTIDEVLLELNEDNALKKALRDVAPQEEILAKWKAKVNRNLERSV